MSIQILSITNNPLQFIGRCAGICWNAPVDDPEKNIKRAKDCIESGHGRVEEFPDISIVLDGESARMMRELYTHIGGGPTRLQSSTRYVNEKDFKHYTPPSCQKPGVNEVYEDGMQKIAEIYGKLIELGVPREDAANMLPLGMSSKMVWKVNLRTLINFFNLRLCTRALKEIRDFTNELKKVLASVDDEWKWLADSLFVPKCERYKFLNPALCFCNEKKGCGRHPYIKSLAITLNNIKTSVITINKEGQNGNQH